MDRRTFLRRSIGAAGAYLAARYSFPDVVAGVSVPEKRLRHPIPDGPVTKPPPDFRGMSSLPYAFLTGVNDVLRNDNRSGFSDGHTTIKTWQGKTAHQTYGMYATHGKAGTYTGWMGHFGRAATPQRALELARG